MISWLSYLSRFTANREERVADGQLPSPAPWDVIFGDESAHTVLAVDFAAQRRRDAQRPREASLADLAALTARLGSGYRFLHSIPPAVRPCQRLSSAVYAAPWIEYIQREQRPVRAVLGYGVGCVYAAAIADSISGWQQAPQIILFDPQFPSIKLLGHEFNREIIANSSLLSDREIEDSRKIAGAIAASVAKDVADVAVEIVEAYLEIITVAFERVGLGLARESALTRLFESYIAWVSVAGQIDPGFAWRRSVAIVSSDHAGPPDREVSGRKAADWEARQGGGGLIGQWIPFQVPRADLLRCDPVARTVVDLLESAGA
jgi:hypothetical protein